MSGFGFGFWSIGRVLFGGARPQTGIIVNTEGTSPYTVEAALKCTTVFTCVQIIAQGIGEVTFSAPEDKALDDVFKRPNEWQSASEFWQSVTADMLTYGSGKIRIGRTSRGAVSRLAPYSSGELQVNVTAEGMPVFQDRTGGETIPGDQISYVRDMAFSFINGITRLESAWPRIEPLIAADKLMNDVFNNGMSASLMLTSKGSVDKDKKKEWESSLEKLFGKGGKKRGGLAILDGEAKLERAPMMKPADADLRELRENLIREVSSVFGVPAFLVGGTNDMAYSNTSSRMAAMYRQTFSPLVQTIAEAMSTKFRTPVKADPTKLLKGDLASLTKDAKELKLAGIISANEARERVGMERTDAEGADCLVCSVGALGRGDRTGEFPTDDGTVGNANPNDRNAPDLRIVK